MPDIFVSYASPDREVAFRIVGFLEEQGIACWVAPRDVPPGVEYGQAIIEGIEQSRALVLILSDQSNDSQFVRKEVERAVSKTKPVLPVRIREVTPSGSLEFFISSAQWVDAWKSPMEQHLLPLVEAIKAMGRPGAAPVRSAPLPARSGRSKNVLIAVGVACAVLVGAGVAGTLYFNKAKPAATARQDDKGRDDNKAKRDDIAFVTGSWCQPYDGMDIKYEVTRTGPDTILTRVNHPRSAPWDVAARVKAIPGGFEFQPTDAAPTQKNVSRFTIVDNDRMRLVLADGEKPEGILRIRCTAMGK